MVAPPRRGSPRPVARSVGYLVALTLAERSLTVTTHVLTPSQLREYGELRNMTVEGRVFDR